MGDEEDRKLFVGGLPQEASQDDLQVFVHGFLFVFVLMFMFVFVSLFGLLNLLSHLCVLVCLWTWVENFPSSFA